VAPYVDALGRRRGERLSGKSIPLVVKAAAKAAGLEAARYGGHSLPAGFATAAAQAGAAERAIMQQTGHKSLPMVRHYIRYGSLFSDNAVAAISL
jgi:integrase